MWISQEPWKRPWTDWKNNLSSAFPTAPTEWVPLIHKIHGPCYEQSNSKNIIVFHKAADDDVKNTIIGVLLLGSSSCGGCGQSWILKCRAVGKHVGRSLSSYCTKIASVHVLIHSPRTIVHNSTAETIFSFHTRRSLISFSLGCFWN